METKTILLLLLTAAGILYYYNKGKKMQAEKEKNEAIANELDNHFNNPHSSSSENDRWESTAQELWNGSLDIEFSYKTPDEHTRRKITLKSVYATGDYPLYLKGFCHLRQSERTFRDTRIVSKILYDGKKYDREIFLTEFCGIDWDTIGQIQDALSARNACPICQVENPQCATWTDEDYDNFYKKLKECEKLVEDGKYIPALTHLNKLIPTAPNDNHEDICESIRDCLRNIFEKKTLAGMFSTYEKYAAETDLIDFFERHDPDELSVIIDEAYSTRLSDRNWTKGSAKKLIEELEQHPHPVIKNLLVQKNSELSSALAEIEYDLFIGPKSDYEDEPWNYETAREAIKSLKSALGWDGGN